MFIKTADMFFFEIAMHHGPLRFRHDLTVAFFSVKLFDPKSMVVQSSILVYLVSSYVI